jgi:hypothetical protein
MGLLDKMRKKLASSPPSVATCANNPTRSWITFHVFDATVAVEADFGNVSIDATDLDRANQTYRTAGTNGEVTATFDKKGGTFDIDQMQTAADEAVYFVEEVSVS